MQCITFCANAKAASSFLAWRITILGNLSGDSSPSVMVGLIFRCLFSSMWLTDPLTLNALTATKSPGNAVHSVTGCKHDNNEDITNHGKSSPNFKAGIKFKCPWRNMWLWNSVYCLQNRWTSRNKSRHFGWYKIGKFSVIKFQ